MWYLLEKNERFTAGSSLNKQTNLSFCNTKGVIYLFFPSSVLILTSFLDYLDELGIGDLLFFLKHHYLSLDHNIVCICLSMFSLLSSTNCDSCYIDDRKTLFIYISCVVKSLLTGLLTMGYCLYEQVQFLFLCFYYNWPLTPVISPTLCSYFQQWNLQPGVVKLVSGLGDLAKTSIIIYVNHILM